MKLRKLSPLNWLNVVLIAVIAAMGATLSAHEDVTTSAIDTTPHYPTSYQISEARL